MPDLALKNVCLFNMNQAKVCLFNVNKDAFNEGLPCITHFVVLHPFLRRPQVLLTFTRLDIYYIKVT